MKKVLFIDDDENFRESMVELLGFEGLDAIAAESGNAGVQLADKHQPALILCDYNMPDMKGDEVLKYVRTSPKLQDIPFIVFSSARDKDKREKCLSLGANDYLDKSTPIDRLLSIIQAYLKP